MKVPQLGRPQCNPTSSVFENVPGASNDLGTRSEVKTTRLIALLSNLSREILRLTLLVQETTICAIYVTSLLLTRPFSSGGPLTGITPKGL